MTKAMAWMCVLTAVAATGWAAEKDAAPAAVYASFWKEVSAEVTFVKGADGAVVKGVHKQGGHTIDVPRLK